MTDNFNQYLTDKDSPLIRDTAAGTNTTSFSSTSDISSINVSKINITEFVKRSIGGTAKGTFSAGSALNLRAYMTYNPPKSDTMMFGKSCVAVYQGAGTTAANQIYPIRGANVTLGRYDVIGGQMDYAVYGGTTDNWSATIVDTTGTSTQSITFAADYIYLDYKSDNTTITA